MSTRIPATVITGFLGAGKTSMIRHLLGAAQGRRIALLINEFGDLGIDGEIVKGCGIEGCAEEDVVELANGCICCTVADDFLPAMQGLLDRPDPPEHIVIETSGLALPKPLVQAFNWPEVRARVTVDGVITVLDGPAVAAGLFAHDPVAVDAQRRQDESLDHESPLHELFGDQVACADLIVVNKAEDLDGDAMARVRREVAAESRPGVPLITASWGAVDTGVLFGIEAAAEDDLAQRPSHHDGEDDHDHDDFASTIVALPAFPSPEALVERCRQAIAAQGLLRLKGFAAIEGKPMRLVVQAVGPRLQHYYDRPWRADEARETRLVAIAPAGLDVAALQRSFGG